MASKVQKAKPEHESKARRQKVLEAPKEPRRPKTHWDHVLEEMAWLSKDFESERKWKLAQAKKVALRASKGMLDQATREEKKLKEEEQRLRKVALNISKEVKKFWVKIEKLVVYKRQLDRDEKKKKARDKQLQFLLGQTERYSTMLAENLVDSYQPEQPCPAKYDSKIDLKKAEKRCNDGPLTVDVGCQSNDADFDEDYGVESEESEDDERTLEEDEAHITEQERQEELAALQNEVDLPLEELLKHYGNGRVSLETSSNKGGDKAILASSEDEDEVARTSLDGVRDADNLALVGQNHGEGKKNHPSAASEAEANCSDVRRSVKSNGDLPTSKPHFQELETSKPGDMESDSDGIGEEESYDFSDEREDGDFVLATGDEKDDETTLLEEEELAKTDLNNPIDEIALLQRESELSVEELLARYKKDFSDRETSEDDPELASALSDSCMHDGNDTVQPIGSQDEVGGSSNGVGVVVHPLLEQEMHSVEELEGRESGDKIADAAAAARLAQPTGYTFSTTKVRTKLPFLLKHSLREYQHIGLDWLVTMYENRLNGILADEMGLGKTIMTIALLAHIAIEKGIWGPHLIVVPTSVMLNWETEFLKWCPAFKILTYFGSAKERKLKRQGWLKPNSFHVCITTYRLVIQDSKVFKRKKWKYLILDEAHLIKNWKSQRWQTLLNFNSKRRILLTGTPLQNDLMELWSLMHFLMPHIFQSHQEFKDWFCNPISGMVEGQEKVNKEVVDRLHNVLRPFLLRRLKRDVEKQLPMKVEHVIYCRLSKRQRNLYEDFIASSETQATLASSNFFGMISVIMQLRKVCNHPDLFEGRPIVSSLDVVGIDIQLSSLVCSVLSSGPFSAVDLEGLGFLFTHHDFSMTSWESDELKAIATPSSLIKERVDLGDLEEIRLLSGKGENPHGLSIFEEIRRGILEERVKEAKERAESIAWWNSLRCRRKPMYSSSLRDLLTVKDPVFDNHRQKADHSTYLYSANLGSLVFSPIERLNRMINLVESFMFAIPAARAPAPVCWCSRNDSSVFLQPTFKETCSKLLLPLLSPIRPAIVRRQVYFPDRRLIQFDCGKLQELAILLRKLKSDGHRALIFTQMTKMLDILEAFINIYGYTYMRLDGSTPPEERQTLMQRFNTNPKIFLFILSTRSGGVGINLVGADTVIFYDSDWNPAMDQQAQDRCHRIGQTREVHIYRLISESTIEENILKKANQKRALDNLVIQGGGYNTDFFKKLDPMELFSGHKTLHVKDIDKEKMDDCDAETSMSNIDLEAALKHAEDEADYMALKKVEEEEAVENQEFTEEAVGRLEDDEIGNEDDMKIVESADQVSCPAASNNETKILSKRSDLNEETALVPFSGKEEENNMLNDDNEMAVAAAAAGQAFVSFEKTLRPIERYALYFLELWDPIIDKSAMESEVRFEEREWELDRIEKYKEEMEAEIDDDEEPLVYETWDADFATEAYRQEVEALAQHQLMEDLEYEARAKEAADERDSEIMKKEMSNAPRSKATKKPKKPKFKSLKKGSLGSSSKAVKEPRKEPLYIDDYAVSDDYSGSDSPPVDVQRKRKMELILEDKQEKNTKKSKKPKKASSEGCGLDENYSQSGKRQDNAIHSTPSHDVIDVEQKPASRSKTVGKVSITAMPLKRVVVIRTEKLKKGNLWSRDCVPSPDSWCPQEDAVICAVVHEYGPHWSLVSETLYGMTAGGFYRGRYRHPVHCCERYRDLINRHVLSTPDASVKEKNCNAGSGRALLKVTEDNMRILLNVAAEQPDDELLLQKHFTFLVSYIWRTESRKSCRNLSSCNDLQFGGRFSSFANPVSCNMTREPAQETRFSISSSKLLEAALQNSSYKQDGRVSASDWRDNNSISFEKLDTTLEFEREKDDSMLPLPPVINLSIYNISPPLSVNCSAGESQTKASQLGAENRFRAATIASAENPYAWALSPFIVTDTKSRSSGKMQSLGKHRLAASDTAKPSKSKQRKSSSVAQSNIDTNLINDIANTGFQLIMPTDPNLKFDFMPEDIDTSLLINDTVYLLPFDALDYEISNESVLSSYVPGLLKGLDDFSASSEYTDIG